MPFLTALCGAAVGISLGLTGGGATLAVLLLVYALGVPAQEAVGVSLAAVGTTALAGAVQRLLRKEVEVKTALLVIALVGGAAFTSRLTAGRPISPGLAVPFALGGVAGLAAGTLVGGRLPPVLLRKGFSVVIALVAAYVAARSLA
jgi:uncharacterized membrane protein YfcA